jgi:hypothetical protein
MAATNRAGVTSKAGFVTDTPAGTTRCSPMIATSSASRCSIGDVGARPAGEIDRRERSCHVERDAVMAGEDGEGIRADLVGHVPVGGDPVGAHHHAVHVAPGHHRAGCAVDEDGSSYAQAAQLPGGKAAPLHDRSGLVNPHRRTLAGFVSRSDDPQSGSVFGTGEGAGVAMSEHSAPGWEQVGSDPAQSPIALRVLGRDDHSLSQWIVRRQRPLYSPPEIHRRRSGGDQPGRR